MILVLDLKRWLDSRKKFHFCLQIWSCFNDFFLLFSSFTAHCTIDRIFNRYFSIFNWFLCFFFKVGWFWNAGVLNFVLVKLYIFVFFRRSARVLENFSTRALQEIDREGGRERERALNTCYTETLLFTSVLPDMFSIPFEYNK